jgi:hypothetical protein
MSLGDGEGIKSFAYSISILDLFERFIVWFNREEKVRVALIRVNVE